jgi:hypothetical protein
VVLEDGEAAALVRRGEKRNHVEVTAFGPDAARLRLLEIIQGNVEIIVKQATSEKPNRKWYSVSAEGLLDAAKWVKGFSGNIGGTILNLGKLLWPDFRLPGQ